MILFFFKNFFYQSIFGISCFTTVRTEQTVQFIWFQPISGIISIDYFFRPNNILWSAHKWRKRNCLKLVPLSEPRNQKIKTNISSSDMLIKRRLAVLSLKQEIIINPFTVYSVIISYRWVQIPQLNLTGLCRLLTTPCTVARFFILSSSSDDECTEEQYSLWKTAIKDQWPAEWKTMYLLQMFKDF